MKIKLISKSSLLTLGLIFYITSAFADAYTDTRSHCRWWRERYYAHAKVVQNFACVDKSTRTSCNNDNGAEAWANCNNSIIATALCKKNYRHAYGWKIPNAYGSWGSFNPLLPNTLYPKAFVVDESEEQPFDEASNRNRISSAEIEFDTINRTITINNLSGLLQLSSADILNDYSAISIIVAKDFDENVTIDELDANPEMAFPEIYSESKAVISGGRLMVTGVFSNITFDFSDLYDQNSNVYNLLATTNDNKIVIPLEDIVDMSNLVVRLSCDAGNLNDSNSQRYSISPTEPHKSYGKKLSQKQIDLVYPLAFEVSPNPMVQDLNVNIDLNNFKDLTTAYLTLCDVTGKVLKTIKVNPKSAQRQYKIDINSLDKGFYILNLYGGKYRWSRKIIKD